MPLGRLAEISCAAPLPSAQLSTHTKARVRVPCTQDRLTFTVKIEICVLSAAAGLMLNISFPRVLIMVEYWQHGFPFFTPHNNCKSN